MEKWKRALLSVAVLGLVLTGAVLLVRAPKRTAFAGADAAPTNVVAHVVLTNAVTRDVEKRGGGGQKEFSNSTVPSSTPKPPNFQTPKHPNSQTSKHPNSQTPKLPKVRKPIANDPKIPKARQVLLANRRIAVEKGRSFPKKFCQAQTPTVRGTAPYVVIGELPVGRDMRIQAVADGARVVGFLPNNALLVEADAAALKNLEDDLLFTAAVEYEPTDKIQRALLDGEKVAKDGQVEKVAKVEQAERGERVKARIALLNPKDREAIRKFVTENGGKPLDGVPAEKSVCASIPRALVVKLAGKAEVKWIEACE